MTYYSDLSLFTYGQYVGAHIRHEPNHPILNIGWLDKQFTLPTGPTERVFHKRLFDFCQYRVNQTRGFHGCEFCQKDDISDLRSFSSCEVRVFDNQGTIYASPEMIIHYVVAHQYRPPDVFIDAVMNGPQPFTEAYETLLSKYGYRFRLHRLPYPASLLD